MNSNTRKPIVTVPVNHFFDDTSTHRSKKWLALHCVQMQLADIIYQLLQIANEYMHVSAVIESLHYNDRFKIF